MNKKGFVFIETLVVLTIAMVSLISLYNGSVLVIKNLEQRQYYDNINDVYRLNIVKRMIINKPNPTTNFISVTSSNCGTYLTNPNDTSSSSAYSSSPVNGYCNNVLYSSDGLGLNASSGDKIIFTSKNIKILQDNTALTNSERRYLKTLNTGTRYMVLERTYNGKKYFASLTY